MSRILKENCANNHEWKISYRNGGTGAAASEGTMRRNRTQPGGMAEMTAAAEKAETAPKTGLRHNKQS